MGEPKTYAPDLVILSVNGVPITGYADGTFISVAPATDRFTKVVGADREVARSKSNDNTHEVTITLLSTSLSNDYLSTLLNADKLANAGKFTLQIKDLGGTTLMFWQSAWIRTPPTVEYSKEITERAWVIDTGQIDIETIGGNL